MVRFLQKVMFERENVKYYKQALKLDLEERYNNYTKQ